MDETKSQQVRKQQTWAEKEGVLSNTSLMKDNQTVVNQTAQQADATYYKN